MKPFWLYSAGQSKLLSVFSFEHHCVEEDDFQKPVSRCSQGPKEKGLSMIYHYTMLWTNYHLITPAAGHTAREVEVQISSSFRHSINFRILHSPPVCCCVHLAAIPSSLFSCTFLFLFHYPSY